MHDNRAIASGLVIVSDKSKNLAKKGGGQTTDIGSVVFWNAGQTNFKDMKNAWVNAGLPEDLMPVLPSPEVALRRALRALEDKRILVRPLARKGKWAVVDEKVDSVTEKLQHKTEARVRLNEVKALVVEGEDELSTVDPALQEQIETMYQHHLHLLSAEDVSTWLVDLTALCGAAKLKKGGGLYFIPPHAVERWESMTKVIEEHSGCVIQGIPAGQCMGVAKAVLAGLTNEAQTACDEMEAELLEGDLGARALRARAERCEQEMSRITAFEPVVGRSLDELRGMMSTLQARLAAAALAASPDD